MSGASCGPGRASPPHPLLTDGGAGTLLRPVYKRGNSSSGRPGVSGVGGPSATLRSPFSSRAALSQKHVDSRLQNGAAAGETVWWFPQKLHQLTQGPAGPLPGICRRGLKTGSDRHRNAHVHGRSRHSSKGAAEVPSVARRGGQWSIRAVGYCSAPERNAGLTQATRWVSLGNTAGRESTQTRGHRCDSI